MNAAAHVAALPEKLPPSAAIDLLGLMAGAKPAARIVAGSHAPVLVDWAALARLESVRDETGHVVVAATRDAAATVMALDRAPGPHEYELGLLLGYPHCCVQAVARIGEASIDAHAASAARWDLQGRFRLIDTRSYRLGQALISHVPCGPRCQASLALAEQVLPTALQVDGAAGSRFKRFISRAQR